MLDLMATTVNIHEAKMQLSRLLERVAAGETITIAKAGRPIADLVPHRRPGVVFGTARGRLRYDEDFDEPDERVRELFEGGV